MVINYELQLKFLFYHLIGYAFSNDINIPSIEYISRYMHLHKPSLRFAYFHFLVDSKQIGHLN